MHCFKIFVFNSTTVPQEMSLILCLHSPATFYPGSRRFHAGLGPVGLYVITPLLCIKTYEEDKFFYISEGIRHKDNLVKEK